MPPAIACKTEKKIEILQVIQAARNLNAAWWLPSKTEKNRNLQVIQAARNLNAACGYPKTEKIETYR